MEVQPCNASPWEVLARLTVYGQPVLKNETLPQKGKETSVLLDSRHFSTQQTVQLLGPRTNKTNLR